MPRHYDNIYCTNLKNITSLTEYEPYFNRFNLNWNQVGFTIDECYVELQTEYYKFSTPIVTFYKTNSRKGKKS